MKPKEPITLTGQTVNLLLDDVTRHNLEDGIRKRTEGGPISIDIAAAKALHEELGIQFT